MTRRLASIATAAAVLLGLAGLVAGCNAVGTGLTDATWQLALAHEQNPPADTVIAPEDHGNEGRLEFAAAK